MVSYRDPDGKQSYHQTEDLADALQFVEHLRNAEAVEHARLFKLEELTFEYRPYYRVELAAMLQSPADGVVEGADEVISAMTASSEKEGDEGGDVDPLAATWTKTERTDSAESDVLAAATGGGLGRKGLFGR